MTELTLEDLLLPCSHYDPSVFRPWLELLPSELSPILPTVFGHLFLESADRTIWFLDSWSGQLQQVADDYEHFQGLIGTDQDFQAVFLTPGLVAEFRSAGMVREPGQVYTPFVSPGLGGTLVAANFTTMALRLHLATSAGEFVAIRGGDSSAA